MAKGSFLTCPYCKHDTHVGHFEWVALVCLNCKKEVALEKWLVSIEQAVQLRLHLTGGTRSLYKHLSTLKPSHRHGQNPVPPTSK